MRTPAATLAITFFVMCSTAAAGQAPQTVVRGDVADSSGGVLPGVTVVAAAADGRTLATTVTDRSGQYVFRRLPVGSVTLTFQLEGFTSAIIIVTVDADAESRVGARLDLAPLSETVVVQARAPVDPESPFVPALPPPPVVTPVPAHDRASVCGPSKPNGLPESLGTIKGSRSAPQLALYTAGAELVIDRGRLDGLEVGRNLVVRRYYQVRGTARADVVGEHSAGLVQIVAVDEGWSVAVVVYACDELRKGDFLASFKPELVLDPDPVGTPAFYDAARILFADEGQLLGAPRRQMVIDRGTNHGTRVGQRFTLFRQGRGAARREVVGDAVVVAVRTDSATIRVEGLTNAIAAGDWAAPHIAASAALQHR